MLDDDDPIAILAARCQRLEEQAAQHRRMLGHLAHAISEGGGSQAVLEAVMLTLVDSAPGGADLRQAAHYRLEAVYASLLADCLNPSHVQGFEDARDRIDAVALDCGLQ